MPPCPPGRGARSGGLTITGACRERFGHCLSWGIFGEDLPDERNRVELDPDLVDSTGLPGAKVIYTTSENSHRLLDFHVERASESMLEAGAASIDVLKMMRSAGWHLLGTARMGSDPRSSVVDRWGKRTTSTTCTSSTEASS